MKNKLKKLVKILLKLKRVLVAFSGGTDSSFLLAIAAEHLGRENVLAVTALSETYPSSELDRARSFLRSTDISHIFIKTNELKDKNFTKNSKKRCYFCKNELFRKLSGIAKGKNMILCDGTNFSDKKDFRPGQKEVRAKGVPFSKMASLTQPPWQ